MDGTTLDDILNDAPTEAPADVVEAPEAPVVAETPEEAPSGPQRDDKGRFAPKGETGSSPEPRNEAPLDHPALLGERRRRQEAEDRARQYEDELARLRQPTQQPQSVEIDDDLMFSNPAEYRRQLVAQLRSEILPETQGLTQQTAVTMRIEMSEQFARQRHTDFEDKLAVFRDMAASNPAVVSEMQRQPDPAEWAYQKAATWGAIQEVGSIDALKEKLRAEIMAEQPRPVPIIPETLADAPAARAPAGGVPIPPPSLDDILSGR